MAKTHYDTPSIWNVTDTLRVIDSEFDLSPEQTQAFTAWLENHYIHGETVATTLGRFKRTKEGKAALSA